MVRIGRRFNSCPGYGMNKRRYQSDRSKIRIGGFDDPAFRAKAIAYIEAHQ